MITKIVGERDSESGVERFKELRVEISPHQLVELTMKGIKGTRGAAPADKPTKKKQRQPDDVLRILVPEVMMLQVHPAMVQEYEVMKAAKGARKGKRREQHDTSDEDGGDD